MALTEHPPRRLGVLISHPIQYYVPWFRDLAQRLDLEVLYAHRQDAHGQAAAGFGVAFDWDVPLLDGYRSRWLTNVSRQPGLSRFNGCDSPELATLISPQRYDAVLVAGWNKKCYWQAIRACWRQRIPVLMRGDSQLSLSQSWLKSTLKAIPYRYLLPRLNGHLYVGQRNRDYLRHYGVPEERLFPCPHFVDNEFFATRSTAARESGRTAALRAELGIPAEAFVALFVGKLIDRKRPLDFIQGVLRATQRSPSIYGIVVGSGRLEPECRRLAGESGRIHFAGFRNQTELPDYYAVADALVLPSDGTETWGLVVNEAMACGVPGIVSQACGCGPDLIRCGETGFDFPAGDVAQLSDRLLALASLSRDGREQMRRRTVAHISNFSIDQASRQLLIAIDSTRQRLGQAATSTLSPA